MQNQACFLPFQKMSGTGYKLQASSLSPWWVVEKQSYQLCILLDSKEGRD